MAGLAVTAALVLAGAQPAAAAKTATRVSVTATDSGLRLSVKSAPAGKVTFAVRNAGTKRHNFSIAGKTTRMLLPKKATTLVVTFKRVGKYPYRSTVAGDAAKGLRGTFTVKKAPAPSGNLAAGKQVYASTGCGACHVFKAAGTNGTIGPSLDSSTASRATIVARVTNGKGTMPAYKGQLTSKQIQDVADFVFQSRSG
jgi:cytochrome c6